MSAKNFTLDEALARIEALEKRRFWIEEKLFVGPVYNTGFTLSKPFNEFNYLIVRITNDLLYNDSWQLIPTKDIKLNHIIQLGLVQSEYSIMVNKNLTTVPINYWSGYFTSYTQFSTNIQPDAPIDFTGCIGVNGLQTTYDIELRYLVESKIPIENTVIFSVTGIKLTNFL